LFKSYLINFFEIKNEDNTCAEEEFEFQKFFW
jgi:hypothetical protein